MNAINFVTLTNTASTPRYATEGSAGLDLVADSIESFPSYTVYHTGIAVEIPSHYVGLIFMRSSVRERSQTLCNAVGVIDSDFRGELTLTFRKLSIKMQKPAYSVGEKIGQLVILPQPHFQLNHVRELSKTERQLGGYGSTDRGKT